MLGGLGVLAVRNFGPELTDLPPEYIQSMHYRVAWEAKGVVHHTANNSRPLEAGNVLSIETEFIHPEVGHVKIEDAVTVTKSGCEGLGDLGREWHVVPL